MALGRCTWKGPRAGTFTCLTNSVLRIDCQRTGPELAQGSDPWLLFSSNHAPGSRHRCVFQGSTCTVELPPEEVILPTDNFTLTFHRCVSGKEQISMVDPQYLPWRHIKLDPPSDLRSNISSGYCILTWGVNPVLEPMRALLHYELAFKRQGDAWEQARYKDRIVGVTWLMLEATELSSGSTFEARLRVQMADLEGDVAEEDPLGGQWSEWSQPVCFPSPQQGHQIPPWRWLDCTLIVMAVFLLLTGLTYLLFKLSPRVKRTFYQNVPSPAVFFQPLYSVHNGNFQTWAGTDKVCPQPAQDCANNVPGAWEAITLVACSPLYPWKSSGPKEEEGTGLVHPEFQSSEDVLSAERGQLPAYLPQEDWVCMFPTRLAPPESDGSRSDYCTTGCYETTEFPGDLGQILASGSKTCPELVFSIQRGRAMGRREEQASLPLTTLCPQWVFSIQSGVDMDRTEDQASLPLTKCETPVRIHFPGPASGVLRLVNSDASYRI
ncbi:interleukin-9 receptor-like [Thomomys bottae]